MQHWLCGHLHESGSLLEKRIEDTQERWHVYHYHRLAIYYCMYNNNICMYLNILSFDNSISSWIIYHMLCIELRFMISLEIFMWWQITIASCRNYVSATGRTDVSSIHRVRCVHSYIHWRVSFVCGLLSLWVLYAHIILSVV